MDSLNLSDTGLQILPDLSSLSIKCLDAAWNSISIMWEGTLPLDIEELNLEVNKIVTDGLLAIWPATLTTINLSKNYFWSLDHVLDWPPNLRVLNLSGSELAMLNCAALPGSLEELDISHTRITTLSSFPENLKKFVAINTLLKTLPSRCPDTLENFTFSGSRGKLSRNSLPSNWGNSLKHLDLNSNGLQQIPNSLPATLEYANFSNNFIQVIPPIEKFPQGLHLLHLGNNRIRVIPSWLLDRYRMKFTIHNNLLTVNPNCSHCLIFFPQFIGEKYHRSAKKIQRAWRRQRQHPPLRTWKRTRIIKEDLLALAMSPARAGRFENISPDWTYRYAGP